jgi:diazepam-binding inhibitor (GABA receptor modulating acyl-CoA-binding protein)
MDRAQAFEAAIARSRTLSHQSNDVLLDLYGLYKQATEGDVRGERPGGFDFKGAAKFDAWARRRGMTRDEAMAAYVELVDRLAAG